MTASEGRYQRGDAEVLVRVACELWAAKRRWGMAGRQVVEAQEMKGAAQRRRQRREAGVIKTGLARRRECGRGSKASDD